LLRDDVRSQRQERRMRPHSRNILGWLVVVLLTGCVASPPQPPTTVQPAMDRLLLPGDMHVAQEHVRAFGFDPGPITGVFMAETQAAVWAFQDKYGLPVSGLLDRASRLELLRGFDQRPVL
jgi:Putative peptidoglycan binding domain